jgi:hypothetical protein
MTGTGTARFAHIRSMESLQDNMWDWSMLGGCFTGRVRPGDVDGVVEGGGRFLVLEGKKAGAELGRGQFLTLQRMSLIPEFTVVVFWGEPQLNHVTSMATMPSMRVIDAGVDDLRRFVARWWDWTKSNPLPARTNTTPTNPKGRR